MFTLRNSLLVAAGASLLVGCQSDSTAWESQRDDRVRATMVSMSATDTAGADFNREYREVVARILSEDRNTGFANIND
jgi:hypothetical protein